MTSLAFFAHPIDLRGTDITDLEQDVLQRLLMTGFVVYDPQRAFVADQRHEPDEFIEKVNYQAMARSSCVVAVLPDGSRSVGVPMEIERSYWMDLPCLVVAGSETLARSWALKFRERQQDRYLVVGSSGGELDWGFRWLVDTPGRRVDPVTSLLKVAGDGPLPQRHYGGDAGFDLAYAGTRPVTIDRNEYASLPCGISIEPEPHMWAMVVGRSSTFESRGLVVHTSVIDQGWRGEIHVSVRNIGGGAVVVRPGERLAQLIPMDLVARRVRPVRAEQLDEGDRGTNGLGSTGT